MKIGEIIGKHALEEREQNTPHFCLPKCYIGLEYEWETTQKYKKHPVNLWPETAKVLSGYFDAHQDGSLRGNSLEFTLKGPMSGTKLYNAIEAMDTASRALGFSGSYRTSLHVHLDMNSLNFPEDVIKLATIYSLVEMFIYKFIGKGRDGCNYCVPWYLNSMHYENFAAIVNANMSPSDLKHHLVQGKAYKYSGLNFFSLGDFGTVEFRHAPVDYQMPKIIQWINIIMRMKKWVMENRGATPTNIIDQACKWGPEGFIKYVFETEGFALLKFNTRVEDDFQIGLKTASHLVAITEKE